MKLLREAVATMKDRFQNVPIFPAIGNHEGSPVNSFPQPYITDPQFTDKWLLDEITTLVQFIWLITKIQIFILLPNF